MNDPTKLSPEELIHEYRTALVNSTSAYADAQRTANDRDPSNSQDFLLRARREDYIAGKMEKEILSRLKTGR